MKPFRVQLTNDLIVKYQLYRAMKVYRPMPASDQDMQKFHSYEYVLHLKSVKAENISNDMKLFLKRFQIGTSEMDCPIFDGMFDFCQISAGKFLFDLIPIQTRKCLLQLQEAPWQLRCIWTKMNPTFALIGLEAFTMLRSHWHRDSATSTTSFWRLSNCSNTTNEFFTSTSMWVFQFCD